MKQKYRDCFAKCDFIRFSFITDSVGIDYSNFRAFMSGDDRRLSVANLEKVYECLISLISSDIKIA